MPRADETTQDKEKRNGGYGAIVLFFVSFSLVAVVLSTLFRAAYDQPPYAPWKLKSDLYYQQKNDIDVVFVGASRIKRNIWPDAVTKGAAAAGCAGINAFNFGIGGMKGGEQDWLIDKLAADPKEGVILVIETTLPEANDFNETISDRQRFFHSVWTAGDTLQRIITFPESYFRRIARLGFFTAGTIYELSGVGLGSKALFPAEQFNPPPVRDDGGEKDLDAFRAPVSQQLMDNLLAQFDPNHPGPGLAIGDFYAKKIDELAEHGIEAFILISPDPDAVDTSTIIGAAVTAAAPRDRVLDFSSPIDHADYYDRRLWRDIRHMNRDGATRYSREIGAKLCSATGS